METGIPGKIRKIREALSEDDPLWIPWNDHYPAHFPDTDVQSGIENCIFGSLDHIYHRHRNMAYYCRIHSHKTRRAATAGWNVF